MKVVIAATVAIHLSSGRQCSVQMAAHLCVFSLCQRYARMHERRLLKCNVEGIAKTNDLRILHIHTIC